MHSEDQDSSNTEDEEIQSPEGIIITRDDQLHFLESMVSQYDSLVQDMHAKLLQSCTDLSSYLIRDTAIKAESVQSESQDNSNQSGSLQLELSRKNAIISNLQMQLDVALRSKIVSKQLWETSLNHVEHLESNTKRINQSNSSSLTGEFVIKWKNLTEYTSTLQQQVQQLTQDVGFYQRKLVEISQRGEELDKIRLAEEAIRVEEITIAHKRKVSELESELEQWRTKFELKLKERLKQERVAWEFQEGQELKLVRLQIEELLLENQTYQSRENQLILLIHRLEQELENWRSRFECRFEIMNRVMEATRQVNNNITKNQHQLNNNVVMEKVTGTLETSTQTTPTVSSSLSLSLNSAVLCAQLQEQLTNLQNKNSELQKAEKSAVEKVQMFQTRVRQIDELNFNLNKQYIELNKKYEELQKNISMHDDNFIRKIPQMISTSDQHQKCSCRCGQEITVNTNIHKLHQEDVNVNKSRMPSKTEEDNGLELECKLVNDKRKELQILLLVQEVERLRQNQTKLFAIFQEQCIISSKWKVEYKQLAKTTLIAVNNK